MNGIAPMQSSAQPVAAVSNGAAHGELTHESVAAQASQPTPYLEKKDLKSTAEPHESHANLEELTNVSFAKRKVLRKKKDVKKDYTKSIWLAGHLLTFVSGLAFYGLYFGNFRNRRGLYSQIAYRSSILGSIIAYTMTLVSKFGKSGLNAYALMTTENFQYLLLAVVWLFTRSSVFKNLPFIVISVLQLSKYLQVKLPTGLVNGLAIMVAYNELMLMIVLLTNTLLFRDTSGFALVIFLMFYWLRIVYSDSTRMFFKDVTEVVGERVIKKCPPAVQQHYTKFIRNVEIREQNTLKFFENIHKSNKKIELLAKGEAKLDQSEPDGGKKFATQEPAKAHADGVDVSADSKSSTKNGTN